MSHFAKVENGIVTQVIVSEKDFINSGAVGDEFLWIQTSYNNGFRNKYAAVGDTWDKVNEVFISPQPYPSWVLNVEYQWESPVPNPTDGKYYDWNEDTLAWDEVTGE